MCHCLLSSFDGTTVCWGGFLPFRFLGTLDTIDSVMDRSLSTITYSSSEWLSSSLACGATIFNLLLVPGGCVGPTVGIGIESISSASVPGISAAEAACNWVAVFFERILSAYCSMSSMARFKRRSGRNPQRWQRGQRGPIEEQHNRCHHNHGSFEYRDSREE